MTKGRWLLVGVGLLVSIVFLWISFNNLDPQQVWIDIQQANVALLLLGAAVYFGAVTLITLRWHFLLRAIRLVPLRHLVPLVSIGYMGNNVYPFRSGEVLRIFLLQRNHKVPFAKGTTTVLVERTFDGLVMLTFILVALLLIDLESTEVRAVASFTAPFFLGAVAVFFVLAARPNLLRQLVRAFAGFLPGKVRAAVLGLGEDVIGGLEGLRSPADLAGAVVFSFLCWMVEASVYWIVAFAFGFQVGYPVALLTVGVVNLAGLIPASPGQLGVFEFFASAVLMAVGIGEVQAKAYALVVHMVIWLPVTLVGLAFLVRQGLSLGALTRARQLESEILP